MGTRDNPPEGLAEFCNQEHERLVRILSLYCGSPALAEEFAQEALITACRKWSSVQRMEHPRAWLHRVGMNLANSYFRRKVAERRANERSDVTAIREFPDHSDAVAVRTAVAALPKRQRAVVLLHYFDGLTYAEIAQILECPENTVKSIARRAREALRISDQTDHVEEMRHAF